MGGRAQTCNERLRTFWTPEMDRFFINLMLEQVDKGNKVGDHLFNNYAWKQMHSLFSEKFKFQYDKDILKNRHKTLRNLYRDVKKLLDQAGFNWDEKRTMVTADSNIWDEHIKVNPNARSYRLRCIPYFSDLCKIYGQDGKTGEKGDHNVRETSSNSCENEPTTAMEATNIHVEALHDISAGGENGGSTLKDPVKDSPHTLTKAKGSGHTRTRTSWQPPMDRYFLDLMLDQVHKGNRADGAFCQQAWRDMIESFNTKFGFDYTVENLKNRYKNLRMQYRVIKTLLDLEGFSWDEARQMVLADFHLWQDYIKEHPDARQFMTRSVPYYKDLCIIFDQFHEKDSAVCHDLENKNETGMKILGASMIFESPATSTSSEDQLHNSQEGSNSSQKQKPKRKRQLEIWPDPAETKKAKEEDKGMSCALHVHEMATAVSSLSAKQKDDENPLSIENVIEAVQSLPDMDEDLILDACDFLEDEKKAKIFLALDVKLRRKWLIRKLRPQM